jgi:hypothetical protein
LGNDRVHRHGVRGRTVIVISAFNPSSEAEYLRHDVALLARSLATINAPTSIAL